MKNFIQNYTQNLITLLQNIDKNSIEQIVDILEQSVKTNSNIYIIGNGGSAATASHMVNDLGVGLKRRDIRSFNIISLADNTPVCSAIANDIGYENIFYMQLKDTIRPTDTLMAISCSGNSPNILKAVTYAKDIGSKIVGLTGFDGGKLKNLSDISFHIDTKSGEYGLVEDMHMILDHIIYSYYISTTNKLNTTKGTID
jgi:D-sedoheptulose 7-phosphate isomerase